MPVIGITGGVATGKSSALKAIARQFPEALIFSADQEAARLILEDPATRKAVSQLFGPSIFDQNGLLDRPRVRTLVFSDEGYRRPFEAILHPRIRSTWGSLAEKYQKNNQWMFAEIPLLYETGGVALCHRVVVTACSPETQRSRMVHTRGLSESLSEQIRAAQMSLSEKCAQSDHLIWNDCSLFSLDRQTRILALWLRKHFA